MDTGTKERRASARGRTLGAKTFGYFLSFEKVTRCKSETISGRYRRNGYVHLKETGRLSGRLREQARSYSWTGYTWGRLVGCQAAIASKLGSYS